MSIERLFNHTVTVYREPDALAARDGLGHVPARPALVATAPRIYNARPNQNWEGNQLDFGPGEQQERRRKWFLSRTLDVRERDVLKVNVGPEAGVLLRVLSVVPVQSVRRASHLEVTVEVWHGELAL